MSPDAIVIRPLEESDLAEADRIIRIAFGTFLGLPDPQAYLGDGGYAYSRWKASPQSAFAAEVDGNLVGSNFATRWGTFAFFGPLTIDPAVQDRGYGARLIEPVIDLFDQWGTTDAGLFTFAHSPKHIGLYQKFGFRPRALTLVMERAIDKDVATDVSYTAYSRLEESERHLMLDACQEITDRIYPGLDLTGEVQSVQMQALGDTVLISDGQLLGFAVCHSGKGSEAGSGVCYIKFGAVRPGSMARQHFRTLLKACASFASSRHAATLAAGVSAAREEAWDEMQSAGFRIGRSGVAMHRPNRAGFSGPGVFVIDDWR